MKRLFLIFQVTIMMALLLSSCIVYGSGKTYGYVTTVEEGIIWDYVWIRAELESSNTDAYLIREDNMELRARLEEASINKQRLELEFRRHFFACSDDGREKCPSDEIIDFKVIDIE